MKTLAKWYAVCDLDPIGGSYSFKRLHPSYILAKQEAERLAASLNRAFGVIEFRGKALPPQPPVTWESAS